MRDTRLNGPRQTNTARIDAKLCESPAGLPHQFRPTQDQPGVLIVKAEDTTRQDHEFYAWVLRPYLRETVVLPQVSDAVGLRPGTAERYEITVTPYRYGVQLSDGRRDLSESIVIAVSAGGRRCALGTAVRPPTPPRAWGAEASGRVRGIQPR